MDAFYPPGPASVPADLTRPTRAYKRHAWIAFALLALFVVLYVALAGWFVVTAVKMIAAAERNLFVGVAGLGAALLAVFMLKALFFVKRGSIEGSVEIRREEQPRLFAFLERLADEAGAPRPHRVFLSPRVNAAVFYDLSLLNLLFPSRKNLELGLALVNVLTLSELKAVCAHEFGHFAQRTMALGRWVYVAQQIVGYMVHKRDALDSFLDGISRVDIRIAWIGWTLKLIVWSIRSIADTAFSVVDLAQRALSREMEMQADLVAVSLTGSDELVRALHRLNAADDAWGRTLQFISDELANQRMPEDAFALQRDIISRMGRLYNEPDYGEPPPAPAENPAAHRVFKTEFAQPPRMWLTHPLNHEREANAKREYIPAPGDARSAWEAFDEVPALKQKMTALLRGKAEAEPETTEAALARLASHFEREHLDARYRGVYWGRSCVRWAQNVEDLYREQASAALLANLQSLYPPTLADDLKRAGELAREKGMLEAVQRGQLDAPGKVVRYRGRDVRLKDIPSLARELDAEIATAEARLHEHDILCRSTHRAAARLVGNGWPEYLDGLVRVLHFADHTEAELNDLHGVLNNVLAVETATRKVNEAGLYRILKAAKALNNGFLLAQAYDRADGREYTLGLDTTLAQRMGGERWSALVGPHGLNEPTRENIDDWLRVLDSWLNHWAGSLGQLKSVTLTLLLETERKIAEAVRAHATLDAAPSPSIAPTEYPRLVPGKERPRQTKLDWWARFQTADGLAPTLARLAAAGGIVGAVIGGAWFAGSATVSVYNGLARPVEVKLGGHRVTLAPFSSTTVSIDPTEDLLVEARAEGKQLIESFHQDASASYVHNVYNIAAATPLVEWTAVYGSMSPVPERPIAAQRWQTTRAEHVFEEPPKSIKTKYGQGGTRTVLSGPGEASPNDLFALAGDEAALKAMVMQHIRWDPPRARYLANWMVAGRNLPGFEAALTERLAREPRDVVARRYEQDLSTGEAHTRLCAEHTAHAAAAPTDSAWQYLADRCIPDRAARDRAFMAHFKRFPEEPWFAFVAGHLLAQGGQFEAAAQALQFALKEEPALTDSVAANLLRMRMVQQGAAQVKADDLAKISPMTGALAMIERDAAELPPHLHAYADISAGKLDAALQRAAGAPDFLPHLKRLVGASDGATRAQVQEALAIAARADDAQGILWEMAALAKREHADAAPFLKQLASSEHPETFAQMQMGLSLMEARDIAGAEKVAHELSLEDRGTLYAMGAILLGREAPATWRKQAKLLLFAQERPYFN